MNKKLINQAVTEANLIQWVEYEILKYVDTKKKDRDVMDLAMRIIERVKNETN